MPLSPIYFAKELSWLSFNERVLQEAADESNPIVERMRFLGIYSSNMDEFFRVRVADVKRLIYLHLDSGDLEKTDQAKDLMSRIQDKVLKLTEAFDKVRPKVIAGLARYNIFLVAPADLDNYQSQWVDNYFKQKVLCHIAPIIIDKKVDLISRLQDSVNYLLVALYREKKSLLYVTLEVPTANMSRFVVIPPEKSRKKKHIILLDDIIKKCIDRVFRGFVEFDRIEAHSFKMTRDADYSLNDEIEESYVEKMSDSMKQRLVAEPVRLTYDSEMPAQRIEYLAKRLKISSYDSLLPGGAYRNFKDFISFPNVGRDYLENPNLIPKENKTFREFDTVFDAIRHKDILLYYPYHSFLHFSEFVRQAAFDPKVKTISINLYRIAKKSRIINSLIDAVDNGKKVAVVVELRARFDEQANIEWSRTMTEAGISVLLGVQGLKIHSKLCSITREEDGELINYVHIGTGNFNESTAAIYTDFSFFTRQKDIAKEVSDVFDFIRHPFKRHKFKHLHISPLNARAKIQLLIRQEIENASEGKKAGITLKVNNLVDERLINELYKASQAGVQVRAIIRGMCSVVPGVKGLSENIKIISIVDRFLEHARVMVFENAGVAKVYISSADWMARNMDSRIEVGCPIYDAALAKKVIAILDLQLNDTVKARVVDQSQVNKYVKRGNKKKLRSQLEIYKILK